MSKGRSYTKKNRGRRGEWSTKNPQKKNKAVPTDRQHVGKIQRFIFHSTWWSLCCFVCLLHTANDKRRMGGSAEKRARRKRAEAEREAGPRGETIPGRIENKKKYPLLLLMSFNITRLLKCLFFFKNQILCDVRFFIKHFLDQDVQPTIQLSNYGCKQKKNAPALKTRTYLLLCHKVSL